MSEHATHKDYKTPFRVTHGTGGYFIYDASAELVAEFFMAGDTAKIACDALNAHAATPKPVHTHKGCGGEIGYDAWVDSNEQVNGGPFSNAVCMKCDGQEVSFREIDEHGAVEEAAS